MNIIRKFLGPISKYDKSIPYTYIAKVSIIEKDEELAHHYFSDTICGLIEYLDENKISADEVKLFGCYQKKEIPIDISFCINNQGEWLKRPEICHSLETHYAKTLEEQYKGHVEHGNCSYEDREREGVGPF
jgi:hypothetical protein